MSKHGICCNCPECVVKCEQCGSLYTEGTICETCWMMIGNGRGWAN